MEGLILRQEDILSNLNRTIINYKKSPKERITLSYIESRLENLEKVWSYFEDTHNKILGVVTKEVKGNTTYFTEDLYNKVEELYIEYKAKLKDDQKKLKPAPSEASAVNIQTSSTNSEVKLPQIRLPSFSGRYEDWESYYDMFLSLIHENTNLSGVQKLHYLKSSLSGEAANLIKDLPTTEKNYAEAWSQLIRRYKNKRYNSNEILKKLFGQRPIMSESAYAIKSLLDTTTSCLKALKNVGVDTKSWDILIIYLVNTKLDSESRKAWEMEVNNISLEDLPTWSQMILFLERRFRTIEMTESNKSSKSYQPSSRVTNLVAKPKTFHAATIHSENPNKNVLTCSMCAGPHQIYHCKQFYNQTPQERTNYVQNHGLCFNCLGVSHTVKTCKRFINCRRCGRRHHTMLHFENTAKPLAMSSTATDIEKRESEPAIEENHVVAHFASERHNHEVLLATAVVKAKSKNGCNYRLRALIDQGSEASFVSEATVQLLGLKKTPVNGVVSGVGQNQIKTKSMVTFAIESIVNPEYKIKINAFVLSTLTTLLPSSNVTVGDWSDIKDLPLADTDFGLPRKIDLLVGVEVHSDILLEGVLKHPTFKGPIAQNTQLGWVLSGRVANQHNQVDKRVINLHMSCKIDQLLKQFWEIETEPDSIKKSLSKEEQMCEEIFEQTTKRGEDGRYTVYLPFKTDRPDCINGRSRDIAKRRFLLLEKKLLKNPTLHDNYKVAIEDYIKQEHAEHISDDEDIQNAKVFYLPHHAVVREDKDTSKTRPVFDASCKGVNHVSLNDELMIGPKLQQDLRHLLMTWRMHRICIVADIVQMYRQIRVHSNHTDFQRILWRSSPDETLQHYRLLRLTFGTACAPYLAVKVLHQLAKDEEVRYPMASWITLKNFYMDDLLTGCESETEAIKIYEQLKGLLASGGFQIQKWSSNSQLLLDHIKEENIITNKSMIIKENNMVKVLGICWNKSRDKFEYTIEMPNETRISTKRSVLSNIARLYDPLGWIAPIIIRAKTFIQKLWKSGLSWDDPLSVGLMKEWLEFREDLQKVKTIEIPRWLKTKNKDTIELHAFADASQSAYAAAVYLKVKDELNNTHVFLITSKTKVAPIEKQVSIPRLELCGALLASKLLYEVSQVLSVDKTQLHGWTDSTVVLAWIRGEPSRWTTFVSNRVSEILTILDREQWSHVTTGDNPADCASRGMRCDDLKDYSLWWNGSKWLLNNEPYPAEINFTTTLEERPVKALVTTMNIKEDFIWSRFSSLTKLQNVLAYCRRFLNLKKPKNKRPALNKFITVQERDTILDNCIKKTQELYYQDEIRSLKLNSVVSKRSVLHSLHPFLDDFGALRVGGRIEKSVQEYEARHPVILPSNCHLSKLIVMDAHYKTLHAGPQVMLNFLRSKYWIIRARIIVKRIYRDCVTCKRYSKNKYNPLMGQLPEIRLRPTRAFKNSGVDFTGFINMRYSPGRGSKSYKGYVCLFVCMATKAIHIEAVSDLTAQGFIAAFRRFVSRRGYCQHLYSDNGTNFVGADKELRRMFAKAESELPNEIRQLLGGEGTTWHYIPPHAPNFGGLWEAGVRSAKQHLKRVIGDSTLTYEELSTVLYQIEACLNSRPLTCLSNDPEDPLPLTPGHFLVGEPLVVIPDEDLSQANTTYLTRWRKGQKMVNDFWRRWSIEYLSSLQQRYKWTVKEKREPNLDDVVIIKEDNLPPAKWLLGKIVDKHTGKDGVTRVVTIKTKNGICKRPCNKLCFLFND